MASALTKLKKMDEEREALEKQAALEVGEIALTTGAYRLKPTVLKELLRLAAKADPDVLSKAIQALKEKPAAES